MDSLRVSLRKRQNDELIEVGGPEPRRIVNGEHVSAINCEKLGLANKVFEEENFTDEVDTWAHGLAKRSPLVVKGTKELLRFSKHNDYWSTFNKEIKS